MSDEFITTEDFINANRSPPLQAAQPNYRSTDTPPPLVDLDDYPDSDAPDARGEGDWGVKSKLASRAKKGGPGYPDIISRPGTDFFALSPEAAYDDYRPSVVTVGSQMLTDLGRRVMPGVAEEAKVLARAAFQASEKLNAALHKDARGPFTTTLLQSASQKQRTTIEVHEVDPDLDMPLQNGLHPRPTRHVYHDSHHGSDTSSQKALNVKPPPKVSLPAIHTKSPPSGSDWASNSNDSIATSPALAKFTITPAEGNPRQLPKMQTSPMQSLPSLSSPGRQTLPSLKTALNQFPDNDVTPFSGTSSTLSRPSPVQYQHAFGPSPSTYSNHSPASAISPPRLPTHLAYYRTSGQETSNSTPSDHLSGAPSAGMSTPTSSYFGHSPANSVTTPSGTVHDVENRNVAENLSAISSASSQVTDGGSQYGGNYVTGSFKCTFQGCNAPPFQTQYLLNSHANVHSDTRPHFCPVPGCPRGPGGQGFKRKNEMIRHGLVHSSPGYVCPFCPDQQHRYPRPDNLQRHVRVHHVDKERDDPLLRGVLAQRPEGGNRGRRRRLGS